MLTFLRLPPSAAFYYAFPDFPSPPAPSLRPNFHSPWHVLQVVSIVECEPGIYDVTFSFVWDTSRAPAVLPPVPKLFPHVPDVFLDICCHNEEYVRLVTDVKVSRYQDLVPWQFGIQRKTDSSTANW